MYCMCGAEANQFIIFMLSMFLSNRYNISFIFNLLSYDVQWADVTVVLWVTNKNTVTM